MRVAVNGVRLFVDLDGQSLVPEGPSMRERPTVLLVHGGPASDHTNFKPFTDSLADHAQVIYYDHRGMGRSDASEPSTWTLAQWAEDLAGLLDVLELEQPYVVGASFGGFVAQAFATKYPDRLSKLALLCTAPRSDPALSVGVFERLGGPEAAAAAERFLNGDAEAFPDYITYCAPLYTVSGVDPEVMTRVTVQPGTLGTFFSAGGDWHTMDFRNALSRIQCPTLVLHGDRDPVVPAPLAREIYAALPAGKGRLEVFENVGHGWFDEPERWRVSLTDFLFGD
ncbi:MAG: alpha/beta fold hydrolase [Sphingomonas sp.]|uniref:alpha/beta fold hydrolase n=1 Tax=Sphingomonas sp. TaxID=28214 RepID=UPI003F80BF40